MGLVRASTSLDWYLIDGTSANKGVASTTNPYANWWARAALGLPAFETGEHLPCIPCPGANLALTPRRYYTQVDDQTTNPTWTCGYATSVSSAAYTTFTGNSSRYISYSNVANYFRSSTTFTVSSGATAVTSNRFAWRGQVCTTSYNYICRIPIGSLACPPAPPGKTAG
jgi:hypothetical protein